jgi:sterol 3beta-glucosyltransferase
MAQMAKEAQQGALHFAEVGLAASQGMDLILGGMGGLYTGLALAEKLNLPFLQAYLVPFTPTREFASVLVSRAPAWMGASLNRISHHLTRQVIWQGFRSADKLARRQVLGLPAVPFSGPYQSDHTRGLPVLYGFSPSVIPPPEDWGEEVHVTGYWYLDEDNAWAPPKALTDFLASGPAPVYVGFGSMSNRNPGETADLVIQALKQSQQRAILLSGWGGLQPADLPESVFMVDTIPHAWLFPRLSAVVHHGGAGTTAAGLRAGVPSIIVPFFGDQPFWGRRVAELGVGPAPIPRKKLTVERLAGAIQAAVDDVGMRQRAARLGSQIRAEDGIAGVVEIVQQVEKRI